MKPISFTLKIALLSLLLSGTVLLTFGYIFYSVVYHIGCQNTEIEQAAYSKVLWLHTPDYWPKFEASLRFAFGDEEERLFIIKVFDRDGKAIHASPHWPATLTDNLLPAPGDFEKPNVSAPSPPKPLWGILGLNPDPSLRHNALIAFCAPILHKAGIPFANALRIPSFATLTVNGTVWRIVVMGNEQVTVFFGRNMTGPLADLKQYRNAFLIAASIALLLLFAVGLQLARQALRPVQLIAQTANNITVQHLSQRVPSMSASPEFQNLIQVINGMLERLERSFQQASRFSADAAHELNTPLTILQGQIDHAIQNTPDGSPEQQTYTGWLQEVQRLKTIVRKLLLLAQADSGHLCMTLSRVNLSELAESAADDLRVMAPQFPLRPDIARDVWVEADADLLTQLLRNLTSNAVKFNEDRGQIEIQLRVLAGVATLTIANTGQTIPPEDRDRLFHRFYRADKSRGHHVDGVGLGLSLSREIARAHHGDLVLQGDRPGWIVFVLTMPNSFRLS